MQFSQRAKRLLELWPMDFTINPVLKSSPLSMQNVRDHIAGLVFQDTCEHRSVSPFVLLPVYIVSARNYTKPEILENLNVTWSM